MVEIDLDGDHYVACSERVNDFETPTASIY
jgi:hypothetical protein